MANVRALNVSNDPAFLRASSRTLKAVGLRVRESNGRKIAARLVLEHPDILVIDTRLGMDFVSDVSRQTRTDLGRQVPVLRLDPGDECESEFTRAAEGVHCTSLKWPASVDLVRKTVHQLLHATWQGEGLARSRSALKPTTMATGLVDLAGTVLVWDASAEQLFGWTAENVVGKALPLFSDTLWAEFLDLLENVGGRQPAYCSRMVCNTRAGGTQAVALTMIPSLDPAGNVTGAHVIATDDVALRRRQDDLRHLSDIVFASEDFICVLDSDGRADCINPAGRRLSGLTAESPASALDLKRILSPTSRRHLLRVVLPRAVSDGSFHGELSLIDVTGAQRPMSIRAIQLGKTDRTRIAIVARDISDQKQSEAKLLRLNRALQVLCQSGRVFQDQPDDASMLLGICRLLTGIGNYRFALASLLAAADETTLYPVACSGDEAASGDAPLACWPEGTPYHSAPMAAALRSHKAVVRHNLTQPAHSPCAELKKRLNLRSLLALPLQVGTQSFGMLSIYSDNADAFDSEEIGPLQDLARQVAHALQSRRDHLARQQAENTLRLLAAAFESTQEGIMITDARHQDHPVVYVNAAVTRISGWEASDLIGRSGRLLAEGDLHQSAMDLIRRALRGRTTGQAVLRCYRKDGQPFWNEVRVAPIRDNERGEVTHYVSLFSDVTRRVYHEDQLAHLATHDLLTGLANRTLLHDRLHQALAQAERHGKRVAALLFDLDNFRQVNERVGRQAGDLLLQTIARRLSAFVQEGDTIARLGSDEFVLLLPDCMERQEVAETAALLVETLSHPRWIGNDEFLVTPSVGAAIYPDDTQDAEELLRLADIAMSAAKASGRNRFQFYVPELSKHWLRRTELEQDLRRALERKELVLHYQPKADLYSGNCTGVEALIRWQHPDRGMISPAEFIPLAESSGQIVAIGRWVVQEACREIRRWQAAGAPPLRIAVNLSPQQLSDENLVSEIAATLAASQVTARQLELEITESTVMKNPEAAAKSLRALRALGIRLAMDDFGTGHSSLGNLRRFPFDVLKIDRSFIQNVTTEPEEAAIAATVIAMAHSLGLKVIAEGVETAGQMSWLRGHLCDEIQGYYLSRPESGERILPLLCKSEPLVSASADETRSQRTLLLVDDEPDILRALKRLLWRTGYRILTTTSTAQALELLASNHVQVIVSDQRMPGMSGAEFLSRARALYPDTIRIMLTGYSELNTMADAINRAAISKFLTKPWDDDELRAVIHEAFVAYDQQRALAADSAAPEPGR